LRQAFSCRAAYATQSRRGIGPLNPPARSNAGRERDT